MKKLLSLILTVCLLAAVCAGCGTQAATPAPAADAAPAEAAPAGEAAPVEAREFSFHCAQSESSVYYQTCVKFGELLSENSNGALTVKVYPNASLSGGNQATAVEMLQAGTIDLAMVSGAIEANTIPEINVTVIPWIFNSTDHVDKALASDGPAFATYKDLFTAKDLVLLGFAENGFRDLSNNVRPITCVDDMKNLKFRVLGNPMLNEAFRALGANPTDIPGSELYSALQNGTVDGQENPIVVIYPQGLYEVQKYVTIWKYSYDAHPFQMSKAVWDTLSPEQQEIIQATADEWIPIQHQMMRDAYDDNYQLMVDAGCEFYELNADELQGFKDAVADVVAKYSVEFNEDLYKAVVDAA